MVKISLEDFKRGSTSDWSHILLGWASSWLQKLVWFQSLTESCVKTQNCHWEEDGGALPKQLHSPIPAYISHGCLRGPRARANVLLYRLQVISFTPGSTSKELATDEWMTEGILLVNHARLLTTMFNYPCKEKFRVYGDLVTAHCNECSHLCCL